MSTNSDAAVGSEGPAEDQLLYGVEDGVATITINRPKKLNALLPDMIFLFADLIERARQDPKVRAVVLRGAGRCFCAGDDLNPEDRFKYGPPDLQTRQKMGYPRIVNDLLHLR